MSVKVRHINTVTIRGTRRPSSRRSSLLALTSVLTQPRLPCAWRVPRRSPNRSRPARIAHSDGWWTNTRQRTIYTGLATRTRSEYDRHIARLIDALARYQVAAIQPAHVKTLMRKFSGSLTVGKAVKRTLSAILSFAVNELGCIAVNPAFGLEKKPRRKRRTEDQHGDRVEAAQRPLEEAEIARLRRHNALGTRRRAIGESLLGTGFRRGELRVECPATLPIGTLFR